MTVTIRAAHSSDAPAIAELMNMAGEGMPMAFWDEVSSPGEAALNTGATRCALDEGVFSWRHSVMAELHGEVAGMILVHDMSDVPNTISEEVHPLFRPLVLLSNLDRSARAVNTLATYPKYRRGGVATALLKHVEDAKGDDLSLITSDVNGEGQAFCKTFGYAPTANTPIIKGKWATDASAWQLMRKSK